MISWQYANQLVASRLDHPQRFAVSRNLQQGEIEPARIELVERGGILQSEHGKLGLGKFSAKFADNRRQKRLTSARMRSDPNPPTAIMRILGHQRSSLFQLFQHLPGALKEDLACGGQSDQLVRANQQRRAELQFQ